MQISGEKNKPRPVLPECPLESRADQPSIDPFARGPADNGPGIATPGCVQQLAHEHDRMLMCVFADKRILHHGRRENMAIVGMFKK